MKYSLSKHFKIEKESKMSRVVSNMMAEDNHNVIVKSKYFQNCSALKKSKRFRSAFTTEQINYLEQEFKKFPYIGSGNRKEVANKLNIPERAVKIWFQNRRMKEKKESGNKELDIDLSNPTKFTNDPLNNACNWQSNNDYHSSLTGQAKRSEINFSMKPHDQSTTAAMTINQSFNSSNKPSAIENNSINNHSNSLFTAAKNSVHVKTMPVPYQKLKTKSHVAPKGITKQKAVSIAPAKKQNKGPASYCPLTKSYLNIDEDMPQDLSSSRRVLNNLYAQQPRHYPVNSIQSPGFIPLHIQNSYLPSTLPPGNVIWKPVNMLSNLPVPQPSSVSLGIPQNSTGVHLVNNHVTNNCSCNCNCHGSSVRGFNHVNTRPHPQYILAIPFSNPPKKM